MPPFRSFKISMQKLRNVILNKRGQATFFEKQEECKKK
jgi:hypothetical protein